jgi:glucuronoarabinoxylan endo-1,4-beta-xylanase
VWLGNITLNNAQFTAHFESTINVNEEEETAFRIFPSPAKDHIQIIAEAEFRGLTYSIFDIQGKLIYTGNMQNQGSTRIDVSTFSNGMYAIQISDSAKGIVAKKIFVKE